MKMLPLILGLLLSASCNEQTRPDTHSKMDLPAAKDTQAVLESKPIPDYSDSIEAFFRSRGVVVIQATDDNLKRGFTILNENGSVFATVVPAAGTITLEGTKYELDQFAKDSSLKAKYHFRPKEFYPDNSVFQFEWVSQTDDRVEVYIDKEMGITKWIRKDKRLFQQQSWKDHLVGTIIDFDAVANPIRKFHQPNAASLGYDPSSEDFVFVIDRIEGDWIRIKCSDICELPCDAGDRFNGWIRWKDGTKLLIRLLYSC